MNKDNAHLYLPLVQALADGKVLQYAENPDREGSWSDSSEVHLGHPPERYRIKPLSFPPKPDGMEWHNPDGLTAEQVGDGYRLLVPEEVDGRFADKASLWEPNAKAWSHPKYTAASVLKYSYRADISTPYPDGSYVKDGQLVKPWVPKFKVGDRVRERLTGVICKISTIREDYQAYETTNSGVPIDEYHLEPAPWSLSRHLPGFRPLRDGEEWHRQDWTEEMLKGGWRPLLRGEKPYIQGSAPHDEYQSTNVNGDSFHYLNSCLPDSPDNSLGFWRTRRPLPEPEKRIPLGPEDVPPGSVIRRNDSDPGWASIVDVGDEGIGLCGTPIAKLYSFQKLMNGGYQIHRPGQLDPSGKPIFVPCHKPA